MRSSPHIVRLGMAAAAVVAWHGCSSSDAIPPADPPPLQAESLEEVSFTIDGRDPLLEEVTLTPRTKHLVTASYTRRDDPDADWYSVCMLFVEADTSDRAGGIRMKRMLGLPEDEQPLPGGKRSWKSRPSKGLDGRMCTFPSKPGRYELRLCWMRSPTTVAERVYQADDPLFFTTPFYRAYVTISLPP